jgi:hypothetical protein
MVSDIHYFNSSIILILGSTTDISGASVCKPAGHQQWLIITRDRLDTHKAVLLELGPPLMTILSSPSMMHRRNKFRSCNTI